nr:alpha/beta hydrolase [Candidatus Sigynarchaeota archaeon]
GICGNMAFWTTIIDKLSKKYKCVRFDWKGHGDSKLTAPQSSFSVETMAKELKYTLDELHVKDTFYIVGDNMGALCALQADIDDLVNCKGIVAINVADKFKVKVKFKQILKNIDESKIKMADKVIAKEAAELSQPSADAWLKEVSSVDMSSKSPYINTPVELIIGDGNSFVSMKDCEATVGRIVNSKVISMAGGDLVVLANPDEIAKEIADFIENYIPSLSP